MFAVEILKTDAVCKQFAPDHGARDDSDPEDRGRPVEEELFCLATTTFHAKKFACAFENI